MHVFCIDCRRSLPAGRPRVVIANEYVCGDCLYHRESGTYNPKLKRPKIG